MHKKTYKFSIVMAVYNVEAFLEEAVESLLNQTIGFQKNVQLILVDDGSTDASGKICDKFASKYLDNIFVVHKANGGVSTARNEGLKYVKGEYVGFLDSDDKLSKDALKSVCGFFEKYSGEMDLVSIPIYFFENQKGEHTLNYKFKNGSRVIDLVEEPDCIQLSLSSAFVTCEKAKAIEFDKRLQYAEDANEVLKILADKCKLGVCAEAIYWYRKRGRGEASALQSSLLKKGWYIPSLNHFSYSSLNKLRDGDNKIYKFIQYTVMYDLQWRFKADYKIMQTTLGDAEIKEYLQLLYGALRYIDDDIIMGQRNIWPEHKCFLLSKKYTSHTTLKSDGCQMNVFVKDVPVCSFSDLRLTLEILNPLHEYMEIEGSTLVIGRDKPEAISVLAKVNDEFLKCDILHDRTEIYYCLNEPMMYKVRFRVRIPLDLRKQRISFYVKIANQLVEKTNICTGNLFPIVKDCPNSYVALGNLLIKIVGNSVVAEPINFINNAKQEVKFLCDIYKQGTLNSKLAIGLRCLYHLAKSFKNKEIWLISDRINKGDDNGEALFLYLNKQNTETKNYFVIKSDSSDYKKLQQYGKVVGYRGSKHLLLHLLADKLISSAGDEFVYNPYGWQGKNFRDILFRQKRIFLQHGITKDDLSGWLNKYNKNLDLFITSAISEQKSILNGKYHYDGTVVRLTGLARYDRLENKQEKIITIMPTWRNHLSIEKNFSRDGIRVYDDSFKNTDYFKFYNGLLNSKILLEEMNKYGYRLRFMPHPNVMAVIDWFTQNETVEFCDKNTQYRDIFATSSLVLTDYSSVAFDFAYLRKPVIYCQFDVNSFFDSAVYDKGYFDYERDGFGEVEYDLEGTVNRIIEYIRNGCQLKDKYYQRIDDFYAFNDRKNCERIYQAIKSLE